MTMTDNPTRRNVLMAAAGAPLVLAGPSVEDQDAKAPAANDRIQVALIGAGGQGMDDARASVAAGAKLIAVADVYDGRLTRSVRSWRGCVAAQRRHPSGLCTHFFCFMGYMPGPMPGHLRDGLRITYHEWL